METPKGECNRTACNNSNADFYNHSTLKHYCGECAYEINKWAQDFKVENGHELCVKVEPETMETLYRDLAEDIKTIEQYNQSMDSASWGYEEGILITGNQAKVILEHTAQLQADKVELLEALKEMYSKYEKDGHLLNASPSKIKSLIQKMKQ